MHHFQNLRICFALFPISVHSNQATSWDALAWGTSVDRYGWPYDGSLGAILNSRYTVICKLGWSHHSNVWLAHDVRWEIKFNVPNDFSSRASRESGIKILTAYATSHVLDEFGILQRIAEQVRITSRLGCSLYPWLEHKWHPWRHATGPLLLMRSVLTCAERLYMDNQPKYARYTRQVA